MASPFNPQIADTGVPDQTGTSRGTGPNRMFESIFSGLADTVQNTTAAADSVKKRQIEEEAMGVFDETNQEFSVDAPPPGMQGELDRVTSLQSAFEQGKISEVNYYGRLATLSKQLRARHPRYESIVDATIQSVTGTRPANSYRDALFSEINSFNQSASDSVKFRRQFEKENAGEIGALFPDDYFQNPDKYDFKEVQRQVSKFKARSLGIETEKAELALLESRGQWNDKLAEKVVSQDLSFVVESEMNKAIGANGETFQQTMNEFAEGGFADVDTMTQNLGLAETRMRASLLKRVSTFVGQGKMTQEQANKAVEAAMFPLTEAKKAIVGGDFKYASRFATLNKVITDRNLNELLRSNPQIAVGAGLSELNQTVGAEWWTRNAPALDTAASEVVGRMLGGLDKDVVKKTIESGDAQVSRQIITSSVELLKNPNVTDDQLRNIMDQFFGKNAIDFMSGEVVDTADLEKMYTTLLDPAVTKAIKDKGSPEDLKLYTEWALEKVRALPSIRAAGGTLRDISSKLPQAKLTYNPQTNRVSIEGVEGFTMSGQRETLARVMGSFNKAIAVLDPIAEANGVETQELLQTLVEDLVDLEKEPGQGFFSWMADQFSMSAQAAEGGEGNASSTAPKRMSLQEIVDDGGEIDFVSLSDEETTFPESTGPEPSGREAYILDGLIDRGLPRHVAEAFVMNFKSESNLNPDINEAKPLVPGSRGGYGLYQVTGPRRRAYEEFAKRRGRPLSDIDTQLDFMMKELSSTEKKAAQRILSSRNRGEAAANIVSSFLRPHPTHERRRRRQYLNA